MQYSLSSNETFFFDEALYGFADDFALASSHCLRYGRDLVALSTCEVDLGTDHVGIPTTYTP